METAVKKILVLAMALGLAAVGCNNKKNTQATPPPVADQGPVTPQPYIPPSANSAPVVVTPAETSPIITTPAPVEKPVTSAAPAKKAPAPAVSSSVKTGSTYVVKSGDSLSKIAAKAYGSGTKKNIDKIKKANGLKSDVIRVGQKLKIPA